MSVKPEEIKVTRVGRRFGLDASDGSFEDERGDIRTWKSESGAIAYVRNTGYAWAVTRFNGKVAYLNCLDPVAEAERQTWGPHEWEKSNSVTIMDRAGSYDEAKCKHCGLIEKRRGLDRWLTSGHCPKNRPEVKGLPNTASTATGEQHPGA
jgi:hypothetical protein